jgi:tellurite methyltransferase
MSNYNQYYKTVNLFGEPYPELIDFFRRYEAKGNVLDIGCGQGRDALALARLGYSVRGIDNSKIGIDQMNAIAKAEHLHVDGILADIYTYDSYEDIDIVLLDSMFHFEKRDKERECALIEKIAHKIDKGSLICICIQDTGKKVKILKDTIDRSGVDFEILNDSSLIYAYEDKASGHKSKTKYCMYIVKKK